MVLNLAENIGLEHFPAALKDDVEEEEDEDEDDDDEEKDKDKEED